MFVIGVDPRKGSHTAAALDAAERVHGQLRVPADRQQHRRLLAWAESFSPRTWAVEGATGTGALLAQQLVAAGESVLDVPPTLSARARLLDSRSTDKTDPHALAAGVRGRSGSAAGGGAGGMFAHWCETLPAHHLEEVRRFDDDWQATASLALRRGDPAAAAAYAAHHRLQTVHPALVADRVARQHERLTARGRSVAVTTASAATAWTINVEIQRRRNPRRAGASVALADGTRAFVGDRVATRRNHASLVTDAGSAVRNRQTWTVEHVRADGSLTMAHPTRGRVTLPADYVARHVELGWAVTGYGNQGVTTDHGICVVEPLSSRAGIYVAMTRGRGRNTAWVLDRSGLVDAEEAFAAAIARPASGLTAHAVRARLGGEPLQPLVDDATKRALRRLDRLQAPSRCSGAVAVTPDKFAQGCQICRRRTA